MAIGKINCPHYNLLISDEGLNRRGLMWIFRKVVTVCTRSSIERRIYRQNLVVAYGGGSDRIPVYQMSSDIAVARVSGPAKCLCSNLPLEDVLMS